MPASRETTVMPLPGSVVEIPVDPPVLMRVDRVLLSREVGGRAMDPGAPHALDGTPCKVTMIGEVVTP